MLLDRLDYPPASFPPSTERGLGPAEGGRRGDLVRSLERMENERVVNVLDAAVAAIRLPEAGTRVLAMEQRDPSRDSPSQHPRRISTSLGCG